VILFPEIYDSLRESRSDAGQGLELLERGGIQINNEKEDRRESLHCHQR
jgi:hypothetical protein